jgi:hypothetical protein
MVVVHHEDGSDIMRDRDKDTEVASYGTSSQTEVVAKRSETADFSRTRSTNGDTYFKTDDFDKPDFLVLKVGDRFYAIRHSGEIGLTNGTTMVFVIFIVWRDATALFDMHIANKLFRKDGSTKETLMSTRGIPAVDVEEVVSNTCTKLSVGLQPILGGKVEWTELDLREVTGWEEQLVRIRRWGRLRNVSNGDWQ